MTEHEKLIAHAIKALRLLDEMEAKAAKAHTAQIAVIDGLIAAIDNITAPLKEKPDVR